VIRLPAAALFSVCLAPHTHPKSQESCPSAAIPPLTPAFKSPTLGLKISSVNVNLARSGRQTREPYANKL
jgi:hypothetical protein